MNKSKSSSKEKRKRPQSEKEKKRAKSNPKAGEKVEKKDADDEKNSRKTRWETSNAAVETDKGVVSDPPPRKDEEALTHHPPRHLKDMLGDKKKIIEYLFLTVTVPTLQKLIPDYLKDRPIEDLKNMCFSEIKEMSDEQILELASGAGKQAMNTEQQAVKCTPKPASPSNGSLSSDLLEICADSCDMKDLEYEEVVLDEEPPIIESEADLMELELRARAIRSLLKAANCKDVSDSDD